jgi:hypothetical protein
MCELGTLCGCRPDPGFYLYKRRLYSATKQSGSVMVRGNDPAMSALTRTKLSFNQGDDWNSIALFNGAGPGLDDKNDCAFDMHFFDCRWSKFMRSTSVISPSGLEVALRHIRV